MIQTQPLEINDFSYGITDYYIDGSPKYAKTMKNFFLTTNGKPVTVWGSEVYQDQLPLGTARVNKLSQLRGNLLAFQDKRCYRANGSTWAQILGPSSGTFLTAGDANSVIIDSEWQDHKFFTTDAFGSPQKAYIDDGGVYRVRNAGLPDVPAGVSISSPSGAGESYLYAVIFSFEYKVDTVTYLDLGPVFFYGAVTGGVISGGNTATVTLPTTLSPSENWDTANLKLQIYRTATGGDTYYKVGQVSFGTSSFIDNIPDATLLNNETLYTTGGIASNSTPPKAKYVHVVNGYGYWAHYKEGLEVLSTEIRQSKQDDPDSVPASFFAVTEQPIRGVSSIYDRPIVLCDKYIYRIDNFYGDDGTGGMLLRRLDDNAGCVSAQSITQTHVGLFWAGEQNFYWSDGFRVVSISDHLNKTYKDLILNQSRKNRIVGTFDSSNHRLFWTVCKNDGSNEPDMVLVVDLKKPFLPQADKLGASFTTMGGPDDDNFTATQMVSIGEYLYRGDTRGFVLRHDDSLFTNVKVDPLTAVTSWQQSTIRWMYESCFVDFGSKFVRKWVPRILVSADNTTNLSLAISSSNDNNRITGTLKPIRYRANITWGDSLPLWGDPDALWNKQGLIEEWRRFPAGGLRCQYKQITLENDLSKIIDSDLIGTVTVDASAKTATLGGSFTWIDDLVDYFIAFENDGYVKNFLITAATTTTLTYSDAANAGPITNGLYKWIIRGYPKGEVFQLNGYVIHWAYLSKSHTPYSASSSGGTP